MSQRVVGKKTPLSIMLDAQMADIPDEVLFGDLAEQVADAIDLMDRNDLYGLLLDFRQWDATVDLHEDRLPLQRPRMIATWQTDRTVNDVGSLRRWCVDAALSASSLHRMRWWLESVSALFEIRLRWGRRETKRA